MIILPLTAEESHRVDELVLGIMTKSSFPMSIKEITKDANDFYEGRKTISARAIRRALQILLEKKVIKQHNASSIQRFSVDTASLQKGVDLAVNFLRSNSLLKNIRTKHLLSSFSEELTFNSLSGLHLFLGDFERAWIEDFRKKGQNVVFGQLLYHEVSKNIRSYSPDIYKDVVYYVLCKYGNIPRKMEGAWEHKRAFIRINSALDFQDDTLIFGDYILTIKYDSEALVHLRNLYKGKKDLESPSTMEKDIVVTVQKNASVANILREKLGGDFPCELQGMLDELQEQKANNELLEIDEKWNYVLDEQVTLLTNSDKVSLNSIVFSVVSNEEIRLINRYVDSIKDHFITDDGLSLIDLGVGPLIKPNIILNRLNVFFEDLQYVAVDYSKTVLAEAEKTSKTLFPHVESRKFVNLDFLDLAKKPNKLLSKIDFKQRLFLFIGASYANLNVEDAISFLKRILKPGDLFIIDTESLESVDEYELIKHKYGEERQDWRLKYFCELGFSISDFNSHYIFNKKNWTVEGYATIKNIPDHITSAVRKVGLKKGDKIKFFKARKPTKEMFEEELKRLGDVELTFKKSKNRFLIAFGRML